ncbi:polyribonucleotide nucleotidyltransferase [Fuchsiella alkaliacetigena]|uniref:polyribonucleotide nucleotidyltransferase n=1 Tax=Fuchsiella alkaliacetigena TaxID=957042 RepID=UPI00200B5918|nr:polyribonucleotide nucleotidyltransferase [Fuchsiella alkaliacetigena]MCK8823498.1 polyribonucleotide nucleotidyltransferase [Fuchsiella alkaliacetigena]
MQKEWSLEFGGRDLVIESGALAKQANGSVLVRYGESVILVTATMDDPRPGMDFFPLMVNYEERLYSAGKIPGGFIKREGRPSEAATLTSRLIDRPLRPLFPEGMRDDVQIIATVLSVDNDNPPDIAAMIGASAALCISDIPFDGPIGGVKVGMVEDEFVINPTLEQQEESPLDLIVAGNEAGVMMVESAADEVKEEQLLDAIEFGHQEIKKVISLQEEIVAEIGKEKETDIRLAVYEDEDVEAEVKEYVGEQIKEALQITDKLERNQQLDKIRTETKEHFAEKFSETEDAEHKNKVVKSTLGDLKKQAIRSLVIEEGIRIDGRQKDEVRPIWCKVGLLPRTHGSGVFTRGETQALTVATLGAVGDEQILDGLEDADSKRYMHHYNFPSFSVGETGPIRGPGRREIGHGALGEKALKPMIPDYDEFPYTIRVVSEVLESNGSTSQASICGSTLALMDAGVPIKKPVAGIAMGLMKEGDQLAILTDIQGIEDFNGDMDFKVAGTEDGVTALQMDIKIDGVSKEILAEALEQAKIGRLHILEEMSKAISEPRDHLSPYAPNIITMEIDPDKIRDVIGPGGKTIKKIVEVTGAKLDIDDDGTVVIAAEDQASGFEAQEMVNKITEDVEVGKIYEGEVKKTTHYGAFVEVLPGKDGLLHISEMADHHVKKVEDLMEEGDEVTVKVTGIDDKDRINLSRKDALAELENEED